MDEHILLPVCKPFYSTYHFQANAGIVAGENPTLRNWFLNECMLLSCGRQFLRGYTSPEVNLWHSSPSENPWIRLSSVNSRFFTKRIHKLIKDFLRAGWYVEFWGVDDYYVKGKSWYHERHFSHDGLICGYDDSDKTYYISAYDQNWVYRLFKTPQRCFMNGMSAMFALGVYGDLNALKAVPDAVVELSPARIKENLREYLSYSFQDYPPDVDGWAYGILVQDYIGMYLERISEGLVPYERIDRRVFRMVWEQKNCMLERIRAVETALGFSPDISGRFETVLSESNLMRMLYARYRLKRNDALIPVIGSRLREATILERTLLEEFLEKLEKEGV